jgi:predicted 2-oxoglutarate/Fe(II)-dependent dioxygenase YbiX
LRLFDETRDSGEADMATIVRPTEGTIVAFPAATLHEVLPVDAGTRDVVVDWYY